MCLKLFECILCLSSSRDEGRSSVLCLELVLLGIQRLALKAKMLSN